MDNGSTSFPKPKEVKESIANYLDNFSVSPGRGTYLLAEKAEAMVNTTRQYLAEIIGTKKPEYINFTLNATHGLNVAIKGSLRENDHVLICSWSHNSAIRPLEKLKREGKIDYTQFEVSSEGEINLDLLEKLFQPNTTLLILNHASNVIGVKAPAFEIGKLCQKKGVTFLLDCTQSIGYIPIHFDNDPIDIIVGTGHKTLLGPSGIGFFIGKNPKKIETLLEGGSGSSFSLSPFHPATMPYKFDAGTINGTGIAGLMGSLTYIQKRGLDTIASQAMAQAKYAWENLEQIEEVTLYGTADFIKKVPIISFNIKNFLPSEVAFFLDHSYQICVRSGIHCAPWIHQSLNTLPGGTIRLSFGHTNTFEQTNILQKAIKQLIYEAKNEQTCA
jgi:cysteine desulfurase family protein